MNTRKLLTLVMMVALAFTASAKSLVGNWYAGIPFNEDGMDGTIVLVLGLLDNGRSEVSVGMDLTGEIEKGTKMHVLISCNGFGTWTSTDDSLTMEVDPDNTITLVDELEIDGMDKATVDMIRPTIEKMFIEQTKSSMKGMYDTLHGTARIEQVSDSQFLLYDGDESISFSRIAD